MRVSKSLGSTSRVAFSLALSIAVTSFVVGSAGPSISAQTTVRTLSNATSPDSTKIYDDGSYVVFREGTDLMSLDLVATETGFELTKLAETQASSEVLLSSAPLFGSYAFFRESSGSLASVAFDGGPITTLDTDTFGEYVDESSGWIVYQRPVPSSSNIEVRSVEPTPNAIPGGLIEYDPAVQRTSLDLTTSPNHSYVAVGGVPGQLQPLEAYGASVTDDVGFVMFEVDATLDAVVGDYILYSTSSGGPSISRAVLDGSPTTLSAKWSSDPADLSRASDAGERIASLGSGDEVLIDDLDGANSWTVDVSGRGLTGMEFTPTGDGLVLIECPGCSGSDQPDLSYVAISGASGALTPAAIPGAVGAQLVTATPDGRIIAVEAPDASATSLTFLVWEPGAAASDTVTVSWVGGSEIAGFDITDEGNDLLVTGNDAKIRRVPITDEFGPVEVIEESSDQVSWVERSGVRLLYITIADPSDCAFGVINDACDGVLKMTDAAAAGASVATLAEPVRLMDTRAVGETDGDIAEKEGKLGSAANNPFGNNVYRLPIAGRAGIAETASAVALNVTAVAPEGNGFITVFPCNGATPTPPLSASLNYSSTTSAVGNNVNVGLDSNGDTCIFTSAVSGIIVDAAGYYPAGTDYVPIVPERFADTRAGTPGSAVVSGGVVGGGPGVAASTLSIPVAGVGSIPDDVTAVSLNIAAINPGVGGFATAYPCDLAQPSTASINFAAGVNISNGGLIGVAQSGGASEVGRVCITTSTPSNIAVDITGYYGAGAGFVPTTPERFLESRAGLLTVDREYERGGVELPGGTSVQLQVAGRSSVPLGTTAAAVNFAAIRPNAAAATGFTSPAFITVYPEPCGQPPVASNLNVQVGDAARANGAIIALPPTGGVCIFASQDMHLVMDVTGYFGS